MHQSILGVEFAESGKYIILAADFSKITDIFERNSGQIYPQ